MTRTHGITYHHAYRGQTACYCGAFRAHWDSFTQRATAIAQGVQHIAAAGYETIEATEMSGRTDLLQGPATVTA